MAQEGRKMLSDYQEDLWPSTGRAPVPGRNVGADRSVSTISCSWH